MLLKPPYKFFQKFFYLKFNLIALSPIFDQGNVHWRLNWYFKSFWHFLFYQKNLNARKEYTAHQYLQIVSFDISQKKGNIQIFDQIKFIKICTLNNDHNIDPTFEFLHRVYLIMHMSSFIQIQLLLPFLHQFLWVVNTFLKNWEFY
jgi:hypothetical protein